MAIKIKLMADYGCDPLWWADEDKVGNISPAKLPLSPNTIKRLLDWAAAYNATLNWADPADSPGFPKEKAEAAFEAEGISLWQQLMEELAPNYEVSYYSDRLQKLLSNPREVEILL